MKGIIVSFTAAVLVATGCAPVAGVVTGTSQPAPDSGLPDVQFVAAEGWSGSFNWARRPITVVSFTVAEEPAYCRMDPRMAAFADQVWDVPVSVAQFSLPPQGRTCGPEELREVRKSGMIFLCDTQRKAWEAYDRPAPGELLLIDGDGHILMTGSLENPERVLRETRRLGQIEKQKRQVGECGF